MIVLRLLFLLIFCIQQKVRKAYFPVPIRQSSLILESVGQFRYDWKVRSFKMNYRRGLCLVYTLEDALVSVKTCKQHPINWHSNQQHFSYSEVLQVKSDNEQSQTLYSKTSQINARNLTLGLVLILNDKAYCFTFFLSSLLFQINASKICKFSKGVYNIIANSYFYTLISMSDAFDGLVSFDSPQLYLNDLQDAQNESHPPNKRQLGRWSITESQTYLEVIKNCDEKDVIRELKRSLPNRIESQIRAHHQKMLRKYGCLQRIVQVSSRKENKRLILINRRLQVCLSKLSKIEVFFPEQPLNSPIKMEQH